MSDTPRTDKACGWPWGHHGRIESSDLKWSPDGPFVHSSVARELERENAALRADKERLDWLDKHCEVIVLTNCDGSDLFIHNAFLNPDQAGKLRSIIDANRKVQP